MPNFEIGGGRIGMRREAGMARSGKLERFHTEVNETNYAESVAINAEVTEDHNLRWNGWREAQEDTERNKYTPEGSLASVIGYELAKDVFEGRKDLNTEESKAILRERLSIAVGNCDRDNIMEIVLATKPINILPREELKDVLIECLKQENGRPTTRSIQEVISFAEKNNLSFSEEEVAEAVRDKLGNMSNFCYYAVNPYLSDLLNFAYAKGIKVNSMQTVEEWTTLILAATDQFLVNSNVVDAKALFAGLVRADISTKVLSDTLRKTFTYLLSNNHTNATSQVVQLAEGCHLELPKEGLKTAVLDAVASHIEKGYAKTADEVLDDAALSGIEIPSSLKASMFLESLSLSLKTWHKDYKASIELARKNGVEEPAIKNEMLQAVAEVLGKIAPTQKNLMVGVPAVIGHVQAILDTAQSMDVDLGNLDTAENREAMIQGAAHELGRLNAYTRKYIEEIAHFATTCGIAWDWENLKDPIIAEVNKKIANGSTSWLYSYTSEYASFARAHNIDIRELDNPENRKVLIAGISHASSAEHPNRSILKDNLDFVKEFGITLPEGYVNRALCSSFTKVFKSNGLAAAKKYVDSLSEAGIILPSFDTLENQEEFIRRLPGDLSSPSALGLALELLAFSRYLRITMPPDTPEIQTICLQRLTYWLSHGRLSNAQKLLTFATENHIELGTLNTPEIQTICLQKLTFELSNGRLSDAQELLTLATENHIELESAALQTACLQKLTYWLSHGHPSDAQELLTLATENHIELGTLNTPEIQTACLQALTSGFSSSYFSDAQELLTLATENHIELDPAALQTACLQALTFHFSNGRLSSAQELLTLATQNHIELDPTALQTACLQALTSWLSHGHPSDAQELLTFATEQHIIPLDQGDLWQKKITLQEKNIRTDQLTTRDSAILSAQFLENPAFMELIQTADTREEAHRRFLDTLAKYLETLPPESPLASRIMQLMIRMDLDNGNTTVVKLLQQKNIPDRLFTYFSNQLIDKKYWPQAVRPYLTSLINLPITRRLLAQYPGEFVTTLTTLETLNKVNLPAEGDTLFQALADLGGITPAVYTEYRATINPVEREQLVESIRSLKSRCFGNTPIGELGVPDTVLREVLYLAYKPTNTSYDEFLDYLRRVPDCTAQLSKFEFPKTGYEVDMVDTKVVRRPGAKPLETNFTLLSELLEQELSERQLESTFVWLAKGSSGPTPEQLAALLSLFPQADRERLVSKIAALEEDTDDGARFRVLNSAVEFLGIFAKDSLPPAVSTYLAAKPEVAAQVAATLANPKYAKQLDAKVVNRELRTPESTIAKLILQVLQKEQQKAKRDLKGYMTEGAGESGNTQASYRMYLSKNQASFFAKASGGICTANNVDLFKRKDHLHFNLVRDNEVVLGNVQGYDTKDAEGHRLLLLRGFNPSDSSLKEFSAESFVEAGLKVGREFAIENGFEKLAIVYDDSWHPLSNREAVRQYIQSRYGNQGTNLELPNLDISAAGKVINQVRELPLETLATRKKSEARGAKIRPYTAEERLQIGGGKGREIAGIEPQPLAFSILAEGTDYTVTKRNKKLRVNGDLAGHVVFFHPEGGERTLMGEAPHWRTISDQLGASYTYTNADGQDVEVPYYTLNTKGVGYLKPDMKGYSLAGYEDWIERNERGLVMEDERQLGLARMFEFGSEQDNTDIMTRANYLTEQGLRTEMYWAIERLKSAYYRGEKRSIKELQEMGVISSGKDMVPAEAQRFVKTNTRIEEVVKHAPAEAKRLFLEGLATYSRETGDDSTGPNQIAALGRYIEKVSTDMARNMSVLFNTGYFHGRLHSSNITIAGEIVDIGTMIDKSNMAEGAAPREKLKGVDHMHHRDLSNILTALRAFIRAYQDLFDTKINREQLSKSMVDVFQKSLKTKNGLVNDLQESDVVSLFTLLTTEAIGNNRALTRG